MSFGTLMALLYSLHCTSYSSIHSWDITISGWEKQTSAILKFDFRFQFRPHHCIGDVVLHQAVEFYPNLISSVELWCYIDFQYGGRWGAILLPVSDWLSSLSSECQCLSENQISYSSISVWVISISGLKKTSVILEFFWGLLYFDHIIVIGVLFRIWLPNFVQIRPSAVE